MDDLGTKLESILNNPQAMNQIMSLAQSLNGNQSTDSEPVISEPQNVSAQPINFPALDSNMMGTIATLFSNFEHNDDQRVALLQALKPFVKEKRYQKLDRAIQIAKLSRLATTALELFRKKEDSHV